MSGVDWHQLCAGCGEPKWKHAAEQVFCAGFEHKREQAPSTDILDARWCADGVARWDPRIDAHFNMHEGQRQHFEEMPRYRWGERFSWGSYDEQKAEAEFEAAHRRRSGDWEWDVKFTTAAGPNPHVDLDELVKLIEKMHLFDDDFNKFMRGIFGLDKDPPG